MAACLLRVVGPLVAGEGRLASQVFALIGLDAVACRAV
jgi:hypothetical protein